MNLNTYWCSVWIFKKFIIKKKLEFLIQKNPWKICLNVFRRYKLVNFFFNILKICNFLYNNSWQMFLENVIDVSFKNVI
jgi:hypothetical protein